MLMLGSSKPKKKLEEEKLYGAFFKVHCELLKQNRHGAEIQLNKARKELELGPLKSSDNHFKACMITPVMPEGQSRPTPVVLEGKSKDAIVSPEVPLAMSPTNETPVALQRVDTSNIQLAGEHPVPPSGASGSATNPSKKKKKNRRTKSGNKKPSEEVEAPLPPTPSLVSTASLHSGPSELGTPSTAPFELPSVHKEASQR
jgi:hypothetical protein